MIFGGLEIEYDDRVLQPRSWTALQATWAAELLHIGPAGPVLELCTGAGQIGLLAAKLSGRSLVAVDIDEIACDFARFNARAAGLGDRVEVRQARIDSALDPQETFAVVIADPPWVASSRVEQFPHDPRLAIDGGIDGLDLARGCLQVAAHHLVPGGSLLLQLGSEDQCDRVLADGRKQGLVDGGRRPGARGVIQRMVRQG